MEGDKNVSSDSSLDSSDEVPLSELIKSKSTILNIPAAGNSNGNKANDNEVDSASTESAILDDSDDEIPLSEMTALRNQIELKRNKDSSSTTLVIETPENMSANEVDTVENNALDSDSSSSESEILDDSDADPDFIPTTPKRQKRLNVPGLNKMHHKGKSFADKGRRTLFGARKVLDLGAASNETFQQKTPTSTAGTSKQLAATPHETVQQQPSTSTQSPDASELAAAMETSDVLGNQCKKRKRRTADQRRADEDAKQAKRNAKHRVKQGCGEKCSKRCTEYFDEEKRKEINELFWIEDWVEQRKFIQCHVTRGECSRRVAKGTKMAKAYTFKFSFLSAEGEYKRVCKKFFLTTLGFSENNDTIVRTALAFQAPGVRPATPIDLRGRHPPAHKIDHQVIIDHIEQFGPSISHYRRAHSPHRRYLPADLSLRVMHNHFLETTGITVSYNTYYQVFRGLNIAFTRLGNEQCDVCEEFSLHKKKCTCEVECKLYNKYMLHRQRYIKARQMYQKDSSKPLMQSHPHVAVDLQKVILIPRMDQFKRSIFTSRLCVYNETFSTLGSQQAKKKDMAIVWHEAIAGRQDEDISSAFNKFFEIHRDADKITLWMDNCSSQNKNWTLYSMIVDLMNGGSLNAKEINCKYFEPGHSFMAADSTHSKLERSLVRQDGKIFDFTDLVKTFSDAGCAVTTMNFEDFTNWQSSVSQYLLTKAGSARPLLNKMCWVRFCKGEEAASMSFKNDFSDEEFQDFTCWKTNFKQSCEKRAGPRGISRKKKEGIIKQLLPLMPHNRRNFWENLPENTKSEDLSKQVTEPV